MNFQGRDIISIKDFSKNEINFILNNAEKMVVYAKGKKYLIQEQDLVLRVQ